MLRERKSIGETSCEIADALKLIYSEKATKFYEISTLDLSYVVTVKCTVEISYNFVAFSGYMNIGTVNQKKLQPLVQISNRG